MTTLIYNVAVPVIDLVEAGSADDAIRKLVTRLQRAGFEIYDGNLPDGAHAFESEINVT